MSYATGRDSQAINLLALTPPSLVGQVIPGQAMAKDMLPTGGSVTVYSTLMSYSVATHSEYVHECDVIECL